MEFSTLLRRQNLEEVSPGPVAVLVTSWVLFVFGVAVVAARLYLRMGIQQRGLICGDYLICIALIAALATNIMHSLLAHMGALDKSVMMTLSGYTDDKDDIDIIIKIFWGSNFPLWTTFYICKLALIVAYYNLFMTLVNKLKYVIWGTIAYIVLAYIMSILFLLCICEKETSWNLTLGDSCTISFGETIFVTTWTLHFVGDILVFTLPWLILPKIPLQTTTRVGLYCTFLLGGVSMIFCIIRLVTLETSEVGNNVSMSLMVLWNGLECNMVVVIACLPSLRPYFGDREASRNLSRPRKSLTRASLSMVFRGNNNHLVETRDKIKNQPSAHHERSPTLNNPSGDETSENGRTRSNSDEGLVANESAMV